MSDKPTCKLTEVNGNVFCIIGAVGRALKRAGQNDKADEFYAKAQNAPSYDAVLQLCMKYVEVE